MADYNVQASDPIMLGMGELYLGQVVNPKTATEDTIIAALKNIGVIDSGASLEYAPDIQEIKGGNRLGVLARWITSEDVTFKTGIMTFVLENLAAIAPGSLTVDGTTGQKTFKIGGKNVLPVNYLRFVHHKKDGGDLIYNIYNAQVTKGFSMNFDPDKATVIDVEFHSLAGTSAEDQADGSIMEIVETFPTAP
ncbi:hypothetical protein [Sporolactobacillus laevolacticus]|uniref:hypothetical protein n=1 Tax=Sporolactobacillus laevolacticus TaxID=33018 RepID=UPI0025B3D158|nr:hypothetical protein [Sporolactobacillus laevolacticus]MDN3956185.1 hypothetical protein [Sporolactobacillus laevolacticus]